MGPRCFCKTDECSRRTGASNGLGPDHVWARGLFEINLNHMTYESEYIRTQLQVVFGVRIVRHEDGTYPILFFAPHHIPVAIWEWCKGCRY
jgi:hypothetical protein